MSIDLSTPVNSPTDIEVAIENYLVQRIDAFRVAARQQNNRFIFTDPAVVVCCFKGKLEHEGQKLFRVHCEVNVQITMTNARGEEARREGINPLVVGVFKALSRQRFGLKMKDLMPKGFSDVTGEEDWKNNKIVYNLEFATSFCIRVDADDPDEDDLLTVGLSYFLQPDDGTADAADIVRFDPEGGVA
jgi:hypothetical protein